MNSPKAHAQLIDPNNVTFSSVENITSREMDQKLSYNEIESYIASQLGIDMHKEYTLREIIEILQKKSNRIISVMGKKMPEIPPTFSLVEHMSNTFSKHFFESLYLPEEETRDAFYEVAKLLDEKVEVSRIALSSAGTVGQQTKNIILLSPVPNSPHYNIACIEIDY